MLVLKTISPPTAPWPVSASPVNEVPSSRTMMAGLGKVVPGHASGGEREADPGRELLAEPGRVPRTGVQRLRRHRPGGLGVDDAEVGGRAGDDRRLSLIHI